MTSNLLPEKVVDVVRRFRAGDVDGARAAQLALLGVYEAMFFETNPGPIKYAVARAGHIAPEIRLPLVWPTEATQGRVAQALEAAGVG